ncbi:hypothetical protein [Nocardia sp. NPDC051570]|uniref:hypothetical protein n=1 Tax=Nocardia sp. NPDC051570 TaxID=3364324 RepID=UPI0037A44BC1
MGTQKWEIDPESFTKSAGKTQHVADRIGEIWQTLDTGLSALGEPWGTDRTGSQFANGDGDNGYVKTKANVEQGLTGPQGMITNIENLADGQRRTGEKVRSELEERNRQSFETRG